MTGPARAICPGLVALALVLGCASRDATQPPVVHYGQDVCERCSMIVTDARFAAALVVEPEHGRYRDLTFDDVGCLVEYLADHPDAAVAATWVRDYDADAWLAAEQAFFLSSERLQTPMLSGLAAMSSAERVRRALAEYPGEMLDYGSLAARTAPAAAGEAGPLE